jgi:uncharacterized protein (UPF0332 family)
VIASFGKEFAKTGLLNPKFHHYLTESQERRNIGDYSVLAEVTKAGILIREFAYNGEKLSL